MSAGDWKEMYLAATKGDIELVRYHVKNGVNPNYQHPEILSTALVASIINNHLEIAEFLLNHGADPHLLSEFDNLTPLQAAKKYKRDKLIDRLQEQKPQTSFLKKLFSVFR